MTWTLIYLDHYENWLNEQEEELQDEAFAQLEVLKKFGPTLGRPRVDTLKSSKLANLKELRFFFKGAPIRILFAFDPKKQGVIMLGGDKTGDNRWYQRNIPIAEKLYAAHLEKQRKEDEERSLKERDEKKGKGK
ncbi:MAG: type II toxin-antitoxin system RelE/ParE family toxin [Candidatus Obscuribacterales bacterium]|nr:type II toxin-antitoxin system RelE/ParE family toxin [Candidatus Obscuribacterales bacterium]